jgi:hypothetical protein
MRILKLIFVKNSFKTIINSMRPNYMGCRMENEFQNPPRFTEKMGGGGLGPLVREEIYNEQTT